MTASNSSSNNKPAPIATDRDIEEDKAMLGDLLGAYRNQITEWERSFCESVLNRILKYKVGPSVKQAAVLDKTWDKYVTRPAKQEREGDDIPF